MFEVVIVLLFLFVFVDAWYFIRFIPLTLRTTRRRLFSNPKKVSIDEFLKPTTVQGIVLPSDLDFMFHMNNSKYLREMDFGRIAHYVDSNMYENLAPTGGYLVVADIMIRYRRSLKLWQRFLLQTKILCWNSDTMYIEQRFTTKDGFVCAIALLKMSLRGVSWERVLEKVCTEVPQSPPFPPEVKHWVEAISSSSKSLKNERLNQ